ncbi:MAG: nitroreductase family protein [Alphaproteobacteria bacterium]
MEHPIIKDLNKRYTTKKYDPSKKVSDGDLNIILEALRLSPSSINSQPWKFIVLESDGAKKRMEDTFTNQFAFNKQHVFECSYIILFAYNPVFTKEDYGKVIDKEIADGRLKKEDREQSFARYHFAALYADDAGNNSFWTKAQTYIALGNILHVLARLDISSTVMEGIDITAINEAFAKELGGFRCDVALAIGYHSDEGDYNADLPKSRLDLDDILLRI